MVNNLTDEQRSAVENRGGELLVSAAAGSGKTKVLVDRLLMYIMNPTDPADINDFLIITYTKAAAMELRGKIAAKISEHLAENPESNHLQRQMQRLYLAKISTVHSFCTDLLREFAHELDVPGDFRVADENECRQLREMAINDVLDEAYAKSPEENPEFRNFVDTQGLGRTDRLVPDIVMKVYDSARCHLNPDAWLDHCIEMANLSAVEDAGQTEWGDYLISGLKEMLRGQIASMRACVSLARQDGNMEKVVTLLTETVAGLEYLEASSTWDEVIARQNVPFGTMRFTKKANPETAEQIKSVRNNCKDILEKKLKTFSDPSAQVLEDLGQTSVAVRGLVQLAREFGNRYHALKTRRRVLDFSDLEHRALDLLTGTSRAYPTKIAEDVGKRFREVLVDEYQDSNAVQDTIFHALTQQRKNCFMVGDVKQSIYQFRLADPGIFLKKYHSYVPVEEAQPGMGRKVMLSANFRSGAAVLEAANDVFRRCMSRSVGGLDYGDDEALREGISHDPLGEPEVELYVIEAGDDTYAREASFVADRIVELLDGKHMVRGKEGMRPIVAEDIAILLRSPGSVGQIYQDALSRRGVRSAFGSGRDLLQTGEVSLVRSLLQIISNPHQDIPLLSVLASPVFCFSANDLARIRAGQRKCDFYEALRGDDTEQSRNFLDILHALRELSKTATLAQLLEHIFCLTRLDSIYATMESGVERMANLREFYRVVMDFESVSRRDLTQFLEYLELLEDKGLTMSDTAPGGSVNIMSIHKSKGLEYPVVILGALSRGFNREDLRAQVLCDKKLGLGLSVVDQTTRVRYPAVSKYAIVAKTAQESISEEMRVLYVAMTRARDRLIMTYTDKNPGKELARIARCLEPCGTEVLAGNVNCPGQWILMEAMCRQEAEPLFTLAGTRPNGVSATKYPWKVAIVADQTPEEGVTHIGSMPAVGMPGELAQTLKRHLEYRYEYAGAVSAPSKMTVTQLKGRAKDNEAAEGTQKDATERIWRAPGSVSATEKAWGAAMQTMMQYVHFECCGSREGLESEIARLIGKKLLTPEEGEMVNRQSILEFFRTDLGARLRTGEVVRDFKFSVLEDAEKLHPGAAGEKILLQGVVDCALIEPDGITIVDFRTEFVTENNLIEAAARCRQQADIYSDVMARIYECKVKHRYAWFFGMRRLVEI